ncbi:hypothetical protein TRFO_21108 [Tritrichomonas foetus]|uniref:HhH-GPD domain-containing protein n=1 Tax=Tritrichomonas foetus TaxID=1144522 RepID=A0A1J4KKE5_9EUKA|nr:hypothetical protein TRFO_21108 [Tritrichomonas foetus]|eukprot:OHT09829.1 hypothetical protein TRFO_21108 [Tritrichomonas foetus]
MSSLPKKQFDAAMKDYLEAYNFTLDTHKSDMERINSLNGLLKNFDDFFYEYVYVVMASGFKGKIAARLTPLLVDCKGNMAKMQEIFKNQRKLDSIKKVWDNKENWEETRESFKSVDDLLNLPYIGNITKYHLARNIGLLSCAKPDLHLCKWVEKITGDKSEDMVNKVTKEIAEKLKRKQGTVDFALWVWLSHNRGEEAECCHGGYALR